MSSHTLEDQFHFRQFDADADIPHLTRLLAEIEEADHAGEDIREEALKTLLSHPWRDPAQDCWVVTTLENQGQMIGFSSVSKVPQNTHADNYVAVHPLWRRQGIGGELLRRTLTRAQALHAQEILIYTDSQHLEAMSFLQKRAFSPAAAYTEMHCAGSTPLPQPTWPDGYAIRVYNPDQDFPLLLEMYNRAFQGLWGHWEHVTAEDVQHILAQQNATDNFLFYTPTGEAVGTCRGTISAALSERRGKRTGYLDCPGVVPEQRANGLYLPLLLHAAQWVRGQEAVIDLELESWGDDPQVLAQYQEVGFKPVHQQIIYHLSCQ